MSGYYITTKPVSWRKLSGLTSWGISRAGSIAWVVVGVILTMIVIALTVAIHPGWFVAILPPVIITGIGSYYTALHGRSGSVRYLDKPEPHSYSSKGTGKDPHDYFQIVDSVQQRIESLMTIRSTFDKDNFAYEHINSALSALCDIQQECYRYYMLVKPLVSAGADLRDEYEHLKKLDTQSGEILQTVLVLIRYSLPLRSSVDHISIVLHELEQLCAVRKEVVETLK